VAQNCQCSTPMHPQAPTRCHACKNLQASTHTHTHKMRARLQNSGIQRLASAREEARESCLAEKSANSSLYLYHLSHLVFPGAPCVCVCVAMGICALMLIACLQPFPLLDGCVRACLSIRLCA